MIRCGMVLPVGTLPPKSAKWVLYYWEFVVYCPTKELCEKHFGKLPYHQQEDARIESLKKKSSR